MQNATMTRTGDQLVITVDLSKGIGPSKSGKTILIAKTNGAESVPDSPDTKLNLQVYRYRSPA